MQAGFLRDADLSNVVARSVDISLIARALRGLAARSAFVIFLVIASASPAAAQPQPRTILLLTSYQSDSFTLHNETFRNELRRLLPEPLNFLELLVRPGASGQVPEEEPLVRYLQSTVSGQPLALVVAVGGPATVFVRAHRERLFPKTPILESSLDVRWLRDQTLSRNETAVALVLDFPRMFEHVLTVLPDTRHVAVIIGNSPLEKFWRAELGRESARYDGRLEFLWFDGLALEDVLKRSSALPDHSAIFLPIFSVDGASVAHSEEAVLAQLHARANAPIFGLYEFQVGRGIVGGPLVPSTPLAKRAADVARHLLEGESPSNFTTAPFPLTPPIYDWRELQRWGISEAGLPRQSTVQFRPPSMWGQYRNYLVAAAVVFALQAALIAGLVIQRAGRRRTELALRDSERRFRETAERNQDLAGRLINAQEEERSRIARDLHDDVSQQVAGVSIMLSRLKRKLATLVSDTEIAPTVGALQDRTAVLAESVRNLSHDLHPALLEHAGLVATLRRHCDDVASHHQVAVTFSGDDNVDSLTAATALCLYRVAQEALSNAVRHARARTIGVQVMARGNTVELAVVDDGVGFVVGDRRGTGLGLHSIDERVRLTGGRVELESRPGQGTTVRVRIPLAAIDTSMPQHEDASARANTTESVSQESQGQAT